MNTIGFLIGVGLLLIAVALFISNHRPPRQCQYVFRDHRTGDMMDTCRFTKGHAGDHWPLTFPDPGAPARTTEGEPGA